MKILWLTWKDRLHPQAGGAEVVNEELAKRLVGAGHEVVFLTGGFEGAAPEVMRDGFKIIRVGGRFSVYWRAYQYYTRHMRGWADVVIDEVNTVPFFARLYVRERVIVFIHQLAREVWFYQMRQPFAILGYILEPLYLVLLHRLQVVTVSNSTKHDLIRIGFAPANIHIISEGIDITPLTILDTVEKYTVPTVLAFGAIRPMKRTLEIVKAFEILKQSVPQAKLIVAGSAEGTYGASVLAAIAVSPFAADIIFKGPVDIAAKLELLQKSHVLAVASVKEGWGLVVTEANSQGTPAVVYDVDGLRDSVRTGETGLVSGHNTPQGLADSLAKVLQMPATEYETMRYKSWQWSKEITFDKSYAHFADIIHHE